MKARLLILLLASLLVAVRPVPAGTGADAVREVLILHSYAADFSWTRDLQAGIVSVLDAPGARVRWRVEYMDAKHHASPEYEAVFLRLMREKYSGQRLDGIILTDDHALDFAARHRRELFPDSPMAACGINDKNSVPPGIGDVNIVIESVAHMQTLEAALRQNPGTHAIHVVVDDTLTGRSILRNFLAQTDALRQRVRIEIAPAMTRDGLLAYAGQRAPGELIYLLVYFQDAQGRVFSAEEIPRAVAAVSPVPVYVAWDFQLGSGVVGGCVTSSFGHGRKVAQTLLERLDGRNPPAVYDGLAGLNRHTYDYAVLQRFGISPDLLPDGAMVINRPLSYFEQHRSAILTALGVIAILGVIIVLLAMNVVKQRRINRDNAEILDLNREVIETQLELLSTLSEVIESRSHDTANHVRRVAAYSALLARKYGLPAEDIALIEGAAPMHDIGKIGIPDALLNKSDRLTAEEFERMKHHTVIGHRILHSSDRKLMAGARVIALQHHEHWDGSGYPCGLKGEEISLAARICALADVYDALSLSRAYKPAWPREEVLRFIRRESGRMFDPRIVELFFENLDGLEEIGRRLVDDESGGVERLDGPVECPWDDVRR